MNKIIIITTLLSLLMLALPGAAFAQEPVECQEDYTVQAGDWLSKIADKYLGDVMAYYALAAATNGQADDSYADIANPDLIEPGWKLCIPTADAVPSLMASSAGMSSGGSSSLVGANWKLTNLNGEDVQAPIRVTANFGADGSLSGSGGCNTYNASYETDGNSIFIGPAMSTMMACDEAIMAVEDAYMAALASAATYQIDGDALTLTDAGGTAIATFTALKSVELPGSSWLVRGYNNGKQAVVSVIIGSQMTAGFSEDTMSGSAGCNNYNASYQTDGDSISIGLAMSTMMACAEPEGVMEQEMLYLAALGTAATYKIDGSRLQLRTAEGSMVADFVSAVTGVVTYRERIALPDDAMITVQLQDVSRADAPAVVIGEYKLLTNGKQVPIPFEVEFDPADIQDNHTYSLSVRIEDSSGNLLFINTQSYRVIIGDNPIFDVEVLVEQV